MMQKLLIALLVLVVHNSKGQQIKLRITAGISNSVPSLSFPNKQHPPAHKFPPLAW